MTLGLFKRRTIWWPTLLGWVAVIMAMGIPFAVWCFQAEQFLSHTQRQPADVLVVEGWIGIEGIKAAKTEFERGGYRYVVATGGVTSSRWDSRKWSLASEAGELLMHLGLSREQVIVAVPTDTPNHRTFEAARAVSRALSARGLRPEGINLFTFGAHARRSRLVFAKVQLSGTAVGVISWTPPDFYSGHWWHSSERSLDLIKESVGYVFELVLNSGRISNSAN